MNDRTKDLILKTLLITGMILLFMIFPGSMFWSIMLPTEEAVMLFFNIIFFTFLGVGAMFIILLPILGGLRQKQTKAEKIVLPFDSYDCLLKSITKALSNKGYQMQKVVSILDDGELIIYTEGPTSWMLRCFTIIRVSELSDELIDSANKSITKTIIEYYGSEIITDTINMISMFCVDRITPAFQKLVNSNIQQGFKNGRLVVGVSFGGKNIYIAKQKSGFAIVKHKQLRRQFIDIIGTQGQGDGFVVISKETESVD